MVIDTQSRRRIVVVGTEGNLGRRLSNLYAGDVMTVDLDRSTDLNAIAASCGTEPIDLLIFADDMDLPDDPISSAQRGDMQRALHRLTYSPFRLATLLRPALRAARGTVVLYSRTTSVMERVEAGGRFIDRPFRAAAHALWRCLAIEWQADDIRFLIIALSDPSDAGLLARQPAVIESGLANGPETLLVNDYGSPLPW
jgi:NAD(P)-dependent dehydrogenase (short-subunit alcohol dehydrogenase family)